MTDILKHVKPNKDCELCDNYDTGYACISCEGDQVKEKYPNAFNNDECIWEITENNQDFNHALDFKINKWGF